MPARPARRRLPLHPHRNRENGVVVPNFFPAVRAMLDADFPSSEEISSNFAAAGFTPRHHEIVSEVVAPDWYESQRPKYEAP